MKERLRTARGRTTASQRWLNRQLNDPYVKKAKAEGYRSRAAYKLIEMDERFKLLKPHMKIIDLGAAPGGWCQVAIKKIGAKGKVVAIDLLEMDPITDVQFFQMDFMDNDAPQVLTDALGEKADLVMSDLAPNTVGHKYTDHLRIMAVVESAAVFATEILKPGGAFIAKVFQGGADADVLKILKQNFATVKHVKPPASRSESSELYLVAQGFKGQ